MRKLYIFVFVIAISLKSRAQEMEPRSYAVVPMGLHAMALSYTFSSGNVITAGSSPVQNLDVTNNVINLGYVQTFPFLDKLARLAVSMPFGFLNGTAKFQGIDTAGSRTGFYDGRIKFGVNLLGSPALAPKDFQKFQEHTVFGASIVISVPVGQYYPSKLINLGSNRWGFKPELGLSHREGRLFYEIYSGIWMYTKNTNYFKSYVQQENTLFSFQAHVDYTFKHGKYLALNGGYADGGETSLNGMEQHDEEQNWRIGGTFSTPIFNKHQSIKAMVNTGIATKAGQNYTAFTVVYQYSWY
jgi:Putative MetA-pathway of phenol degradation